MKVGEEEWELCGVFGRRSASKKNFFRCQLSRNIYRCKLNKMYLYIVLGSQTRVITGWGADVITSDTEVFAYGSQNLGGKARTQQKCWELHIRAHPTRRIRLVSPYIICHQRRYLCRQIPSVSSHGKFSKQITCGPILTIRATQEGITEIGNI